MSDVLWTKGEEIRVVVSACHRTDVTFLGVRTRLLRVCAGIDSGKSCLGRVVCVLALVVEYRCFAEMPPWRSKHAEELQHCICCADG